MFSSSRTVSCSVYIHYIGNKVMLTSSPYFSNNIFVCVPLDGKYHGSLFACNKSHNMLWPLYKFGDCGSQCYSILGSIWKLTRNCVTVVLFSFIGQPVYTLLVFWGLWFDWAKSGASKYCRIHTRIIYYTKIVKKKKKKKNCTFLLHTHKIFLKEK